MILEGKGYRRAHRVSYELANGPIPAGLCVLHHCDNRPCIRPSHLFLGTRRDNALDKTLKGRVRHSRQGLPFGVARQRENAPKPYKAQIVENRKINYLGSFATIEEAAAVAAQAREQRAARFLLLPPSPRPEPSGIRLVGLPENRGFQTMGAAGDSELYPNPAEQTERPASALQSSNDVGAGIMLARAGSPAVRG
jgi:hypothetical protein